LPKGCQKKMRTFIGSVIAITVLSASGTEALPLFPQAGSQNFVENVKVICHEDGYCSRPPVRRPVAKWVYGDRNFYGPYYGPGNYGNTPRLHYRWGPYFWY
jgi:hypothetical protein